MSARPVMALTGRGHFFSIFLPCENPCSGLLRSALPSASSSSAGGCPRKSLRTRSTTLTTRRPPMPRCCASGRAPPDRFWKGSPFIWLWTSSLWPSRGCRALRSRKVSPGLLLSPAALLLLRSVKVPHNRVSRRADRVSRRRGPAKALSGAGSICSRTRFRWNRATAGFPAADSKPDGCCDDGAGTREETWRRRGSVL